MKWFMRSFVFIATFLIGTIAFSASISTGLQNCTVDLSGAQKMNSLPYIAEQTNEDRAAIYAAVLNNSHYKDNGMLVIGEMSERGGTMMDEQIDKGNVPGACSDTIADYKANNSTPVSLRESLSKYPNIVFWTDKENEVTFGHGRDGIKEFFKKYPKSGGLLSVSNIGFNAKHDQALVYFSYYCGMLCAGGSFIILEKKDRHWIVSRNNELWVS